MYEMLVSYGEVNQWSNTEGAGSYVTTKNIRETFRLEELTRKDIVEALKEYFYIDIEEEDLFFENGDTGLFTVIEDSQGIQITEPDEDEQAFEVIYSFIINELNPRIDLEAYFSEN